MAPVSLRLMGLSELVCSAGLVGALRVDVIYAPTASMISRRKGKASCLAGKRGGQMSSSEEYREYVLELLSGLEEVSYRKMMGEYVLYYRSKVVGGIYDDRFLLKVTPASERLLPEASRAIPYEGAKEMLLVEVEDRDVLRDVVDAMWEEVPTPKKRNKK